MFKVIVALMLLTSVAYAESFQNPQGTAFNQYSGDQVVKVGSATVKGIVVGYKGVTAGDWMTLSDGTTVGSTVDMSIYASAANGNTVIPFNFPMEFDNGIYIHEQKTGGAFYTSIQTQ